MSGDDPQKPKILDQVRRRTRAQHLSLSTKKAYFAWIRRYILFHGKRHPKEMAEHDVNGFLTYLRTGGRIYSEYASDSF